MKSRTEVCASNSGASDTEKENATKAAAAAKKALDEAMTKYDKGSIDRLSAMNVEALNKVYAGPKEALRTALEGTKQLIGDREQERDALLAKNVGDAALNDVLPPGAADTPAAPKSVEEDYFTQISVEISSSSATSSTSDHSAQMASQSMQSHGWWFWRSTSKEESKSESSSSDAMSQMANSDVKISFECMRVDIERAWMRPELFYDDDLRAAPGAL